MNTVLTRSASGPEMLSETEKSIMKLQRQLDNLEARDSCARKSLDEVMNNRNQLNLRQLDLSRRFSIFSEVRSMLEHHSWRNGGHSKIDALDNEILQVRQQLARLKHQRQEVVTELVMLKASISASGRIPPEIWAHIFYSCLPDDQIYVRPSIRRAPLLLCRVSRLWRNIAISAPDLWSSLSVNKSWKRRHGKSLLELWLQRSGKLPLSLEISISLYMEPTWDSRTLRLVLSQSERWYRLRLNLTDYLLRSILSKNMPLLHTLEFNSNFAIASLNITPEFAPNLRQVSLLTVPIDPAPLSLPWDQLTHLTSRFWDDVQCHLEILKRCPNLRKCRLHLLHAQWSLPTNESIFMPHLQSLEVVAFIGSAMGPILDRLILPSLTELCFIVPDESPACGISGWPKPRVKSLIERSSCELMRIRLKGIEIDYDDVDEVFNPVVLISEMV